MSEHARTGGIVGERWSGRRALKTVALCVVGVVMPLGCVMPTPEPGSRNEDAGAADAVVYDAAVRDADVGDVRDATMNDGSVDAAIDTAGDASGAPDAIDDIAVIDGATEGAETATDAVAADVAADDAAHDATTADAGAEDATIADAATADVEFDAPEGNADDDVATDAATISDAGVVIIGGGTGFPLGTCVSAADPRTFALSNPGDSPADWTSSVTTSSAPSSLAMLVPSSGTVPPGQSVTVSMVFPLISDPLPATPVQVQFVSGGSTTTRDYLFSVEGYEVSAPATVDFGDIAGSADFLIDVLETASVGVSGVDDNGAFNQFLTPCVVFNTALSGSSLFRTALFLGSACNPSPTGPAQVGFEFVAPIGTLPGMYQATVTFIPSPDFGPPCHSPPPILLKANLLAPADSGP